MNPADKITALEEKRDALESQLVTGMDKEERIAIRNQIVAIGQEITGYVTKLPVQAGPPIILPFFGYEFDRNYIGLIEIGGCVVSLLGIFTGAYIGVRKLRIAFFKYRFARVPFHDYDVAFYCQQFDLPLASFKVPPHSMAWQKEAAVLRSPHLLGTVFCFSLVIPPHQSHLPPRSR